MTSSEEKARRRELARAERERRAREERPGKRGCWCGPDDAWCATCEVCGRPGHMRHFPGSAPVTGRWCAYHYWRLKILSPAGTIGCWLWPALGIFTLAVLARLLGV